MRRLTALLLALLLLTGCGPQAPERKQYTATFLTLFDTVTTVVGPAETKEAFSAWAQAIHDELEIYHRLFDIYHEYDNMANLKTLNELAAGGPIAVDRAILELLLDCKDYYAASGGRVNAAMGAVLQLWHQARSDSLNDPASAYLPDPEALAEASRHCDLNDVIIDWEASTVYFADPLLKLDVGAIAKGWAVQRVCEVAPKGLLVSVGGNVCATGPKDDRGTPWVIGVQDPDGGDYLHTLNIPGGSVVTSGDYQRAFQVEGKLYHHIIDPQTLQPGTLWRSVTIVCGDSGLADALSTALFLMSREEGQQLLDRYGAQALWVSHSGELLYSPGFQELIRT